MLIFPSCRSFAIQATAVYFTKPAGLNVKDGLKSCFCVLFVCCFLFVYFGLLGFRLGGVSFSEFF